MALIHEELSRQFHDWELRGRGWTVYPEPIRPEPPFRHFEGHFVKESAADDGRKPTFISSLVKRLCDSLKPPQDNEAPMDEDELSIHAFERAEVVELRAVLPAKLNISNDAFDEFLSNISLCESPIAFEIVGKKDEVAIQFACDPADAFVIRRQLEAHFPEAMFQETGNTLEDVWDGSSSEEALVVEFGLEREFMFPLRVAKSEAFVGIVGALSQLADEEIAVFQVLFEPARESWQESIEYSVSHADGKPFFVNAPELSAAAKKKITHALYGVVVRIAILSGSFNRTRAIARDLGGSLRVFANPSGNELIPLKNSDYPFEDHVHDLLCRQSRRSGMLLTKEELVGLVHLPSPAVRSQALLRESGKSKAPPNIACDSRGVLLGENAHAGKTTEVRLTPEQRVRHMHVIGASGTGKSTLLFNLIRSDIENNQGVALLDPHGDLVDRILGVIPPERMGDVILVDPSDEQFSIGFNILSAHSDLEKTLLASDLVSVFQRLSTSWGDQMGSVLQNAILAFLESETGGTLADMRRFLIEPPFREKFLKTVRDPDIVYYWRKGFAQLAGNKSIGSVLTRLDTFLAPKPIRYMVSQTENRLDFGEIMDGGKIFLAKLPQGKMGKENSFLLGSLIVSKFQQIAMSRQNKAVENRRDFWLYLDEFHNFMTPSMAEILSGARKYRLGLILAHQELRQLDRDRDVGSAVLTNPYTRIIFRVGDADARALESGLSFFEASDLQNLETGKAICRIEKASGDFNLSIRVQNDVSKHEAKACKRAVTEASRLRYGTPRAKIEADLLAKIERDSEGELSKTKKTPIPEQKPPAAEPPPQKSEKPLVSESITPASPAAPDQPSPTEAIAPIKTPNEPPKAETPPDIVGQAPVILSEAARAALDKKEEPPTQHNEEKVEQPAPRDLGQGGARHKILQKRIQEAGEAAGFTATIEKQIPNSEKRIDVYLERSDLTIACEISFETTADHEVGNVLKCLRAGAMAVAIICLEQNRLTKIKKAVDGTFAPEEALRVQYFEPAQFIAHLKTLQLPPAAPTEPKKGKGRTIKRTQSNLSKAERDAREEEYNRAIAEALKKKKRKGSSE
jgi:hypothetical protein